MASRPLSVSAGLCSPETPPARADATFKVTMVPGDGVGPELMTAVKEVFKVHLHKIDDGLITAFYPYTKHVVFSISGLLMIENNRELLTKNTCTDFFFSLSGLIFYIFLILNVKKLLFHLIVFYK